MDDLLQQMIEEESNVIHRISPDRKAELGHYRFLSNSKVEMGQMIGQLVSPMRDLVKGRDLLVISDSSEVSLQKHLQHIKDAERIGYLSDNKSRGFHKHLSLCLDAESGVGLGLSDLMLWNRAQSSKTKKQKQDSKRSRKWSEKETNKWRLAVEQSEQVLALASSRTYIFDAAADLGDLWQYADRSRADFLIRLRYDRLVLDAPSDGSSAHRSKLVNQLISEQEVVGSYQFKLRPLTGRNIYQPKYRQARLAKMEVRYMKAYLPKYDQLRPFFIVQAREDPSTVADGEEPIDWILLTTHPITSFDQAYKIIYWYSLRWMIEQLFRTSKKKGFDIESSELRSLDAIMKQTILTMGAAFKVMQLVLARDKPDHQAISDLFTQQQILCLISLCRKYEGKTQKQKNPFPKKSLAWAAWVIARLGGWKGYQKARPPGPIRMKRGLEKFYHIFQGWKLLDGGKLM